MLSTSNHTLQAQISSGVTVTHFHMYPAYARIFKETFELKHLPGFISNFIFNLIMNLGS